MAPRKIIIDTDPGIDDVLAILAALASSDEDLQVLLVSLTFGNCAIDQYILFIPNYLSNTEVVRRCLRNAVSLFGTVDKELVYRKENNLELGFKALRAHKPILAVGADRPLEDQEMLDDGFHGLDGLAGLHTKAPHLSPQETWDHLFDPAQQSSPSVQEALTKPRSFTPSTTPAHLEILNLLRTNDPETITIVAVGPLTNLALAAAEDVETFLRVKEVVIMGGAIDIEGNTTPVAEFNIFADAVAAARVFALTSPVPRSTMPPCLSLKPYPSHLSKRLKLTMVPWDITTRHLLNEKLWKDDIVPLKEKGSPLAEWADVFIHSTFRKMESFYVADDDDKGKKARVNYSDICLNDPLCIYYILYENNPGWKVVHDLDVRVESTGQWCRGMTVVDKRNRKKAALAADVDEGVKVPGDCGDWLHPKLGNRVTNVLESPDEKGFGKWLMDRIFF